MIALLLSALVLAACQSAPVTGRSQLMLVSEEEERQAGLLAFHQVRTQEPPSHDAAANELVERVSRRIAAAAEAPPDNLWKAPHYRWEFEVIDKRIPNAGCLPGGKIYVYTGLLPITQDDAGMAAVIGHEVAHALARHGAERMSDKKAVSIAAAAAVVALAVNSRTSALAPATMVALGAGAKYGILLPMSRTQESEADRIGLILMALAGYDPNEAVNVWERMRLIDKGPNPPIWASTHPSDEQRIKDLKAWVPEAMKYYHPQ
ncbi:M48 family metallopeptidase [Enhydrobacter aerosaccus]|nr:M48 family metallopeptidase [Enhydrobacter aerosaccus]